jgi:threonyl-tRNA synthetase
MGKIGDGAFYGPKIDLHIRDALNRTWQCGTIQLDMNFPERFNLNYIDKDNQKHRPIMIHRTIFGSIERFLGILIEHFAGKFPLWMTPVQAFPLWMTPVQAIVLPINDDLVPYAGEVKDKLRNAGLRVEIDSRTESLNKKVREAQLNYFPLILTIGGKEMEAGTLAVRTLDGKVKYGVSHEMFLNTVLDHIHRRDLSLNIFPD